jgi:hypothetical protein
MGIDDVDTALDIRHRYQEILKKGDQRTAFEAQEFLLVNPATCSLCRYDTRMLRVKNDLDNNMAKEAIEECDTIINENPSPKLVQLAKDKKAEAEKLLKPGP